MLLLSSSDICFGLKIREVVEDVCNDIGVLFRNPSDEVGSTIFDYYVVGKLDPDQKPIDPREVSFYGELNKMPSGIIEIKPRLWAPKDIILTVREKIQAVKLVINNQ